MENLNMAVHWKIRFLEVGVHEKPINCPKSGAWAFCGFKRGGLGKNKGSSVDILKLKKNTWHIPFYKDEKKLILCCSWSILR